MSTRKITTYTEAFDLINVTLTQKVMERMREYEKQGHTEKCICYTIWRKADKLKAFRMDSRFWAVFDNELRKYSWTKDAPRWKEYNHNKAK